MSAESDTFIAQKPTYDNIEVLYAIKVPLCCILSEPRWPRHETDPLDTQTISSERVLTSGFSYGKLFEMRRKNDPASSSPHRCCVSHENACPLREISLRRSEKVLKKVSPGRLLRSRIVNQSARNSLPWPRTSGWALRAASVR